jgi:beta-lactamase superfamily II metal-dependent hydrolase
MKTCIPLSSLRLLALGIVLSLYLPAFGQANSKLQFHFINVGQDEGLLVSRGGETVLFDNRVHRDGDRAKSHLQQLGVTDIEYHADHIGRTVSVLQEFPLKRRVFNCFFAKSTSRSNLETNSVRPADRTLRIGCPE